MIKCLAEEVQAGLRSGVAINSIGQCVEEIILNSIDAKATCVAVRVDLETFKVQVVDNGCGIGKEDLNKVGNRYFTSKICSLEDLENLKFYGFRGEALASIASMASILEISSKTNKIAKTFLKLFHNGKGLEVSETELNRPSVGTTVTVYNLFYQLPVRRKSMDPILEFERVRHKIEALSLIQPSVSFSLRNDASCSMVLQLSKTKDICSRFSQIYGLSKSQKLREINYMSGGFEIDGFISSEGHYNKNIQFLYVNKRLILRTRLHKLIDFLLRKQSIICKTKSRSLISSLTHHRSSQELYGVFIINVKCQHNEYDVCLEPAKTLIEFRSWDALLTCIEEGVKTFLKREQLFIELCGEEIKEFNENNNICLSDAITVQPFLSQGKGMQESFKRACDNIADTYEMFNLQSKSVRRKIPLANKVSDHTGPIYYEEGLVHPDVIGTEVVHELTSNNKGEPYKNDTIPDVHKLSNLYQESKVSVNQNVQVLNCTCPEELDKQDRSVVLETEKHAGTSFSMEKYDKSSSNCQDKMLQEGSSNSAAMGHFETVDDADKFKCQLPLGCGSMGKYKAMKEGREHDIGSKNIQELVMEQEPLKLCSTGLITHLMQNQPPCKRKEIKNSQNRQPRLGPVSAKNILGGKPTFSGLSSNIQECLSITNGKISTANPNEWTEKGNFPGQKSISSLPADGNVDGVTSHIKEFISVAPSSSVHLDSTIKSREMAALSLRPRLCGINKLSLHPKLGSLDKFRRCYGSIKNAPPITNVEKKNEVEVPAFARSPGYENMALQNSSICETPTNESVVSNNSGYDFLPLEKSQNFTEESLLSRKVLNVDPLTLTDNSQIRKKSFSGTKFTGTLASKVSRMKGSFRKVLSMESTGKLLEQACLSQKDKDRWNLLPPRDCLQSICHTTQLSPREVGTENHCFASVSDKQDNSMVVSSTRVEDVGDAVKHCFIDTGEDNSTSQNINMTDKAMDSKGICEDTGIMDGSTKQAMKACELPSMNLSSNMEDATDDSSTIQIEESQPHSSKWFHQFDASLGKIVYINKVTGLSTYSAPSEEPQAICTKDISTMAVNVIENGFQCRCYPFRSEFIVPFLPRPQKERSLTSQGFRDTQGESLQSLFSEWDNPVFARCPEVAVDVSSRQADSLAVKIHNILYPYRFTKKMIESMQVLNQVDNKFIACLINTRADEKEETDGNLLVLVDQHAAHERVRLEQLIKDSYEKQPEALGKKKLLASTVCPALEIEITEDQRRLLGCYHKSLEDLGLELFFPKNNSSQILVGKVPLCFVEREANELRRGRQTVAKSIVQEFIHEQVELLQTTGGAQTALPLTVLKVLASQACHGAIKFNDSLTLEESCHLMEALSCCQLPFQCAHGRPSMLPLADVDHLQQESQPKPNLAKLRRMTKAWQLFGKEKESDCASVNSILEPQ
ncbi:DNA mismatch repair protein Mlh3 isoform X1 [Varanus komodoensis]|uniref:DNA mismatch repair protein Mlh3 isoform X1 n=1 Tax=Varanus komodoensis TaxID=61221 RepID=UPI001CF781A0|nr:DNA mismatch repair protein Mlh3 isoform X1 [Varanus komodoensis]